MASRKVLLLVALVAAALVAAANAAAAEYTEAKEVQETFVGPKVAPTTDALTKKGCYITSCGTTTVTVPSTYYYYWYGPNLIPGSSVSTGGRSVGPCISLWFGPGCWRCLVRQTGRSTRTYPIFVLGSVCPKTANGGLVFSSHLATTRWLA